MKIKYLLPVLAGAAMLTGCAAALQDRPDDAGGKDPDAIANATAVTAYLNADGVPNVGLFCIGPFRFASTMNGAEGKSAVLVRLAEDDAKCSGGKPQ